MAKSQSIGKRTIPARTEAVFVAKLVVAARMQDYWNVRTIVTVFFKQFGPVRALA
jgi:hypothetical protein